MFKRSSHKIPARHKKRDPKPGAKSPRVPGALPGWLPHHTSDFEAWGVAAERARDEFYAAWRRSTNIAGDESLRQAADEAQNLWSYTLERAFPPGFWEGMAAMLAGSTENVEIYIAFLEADPRFFRSGYVKSDVMRGVKRLQLTAQQQHRLQDVVLRAVDKGLRARFQDYCRLARYVQSPGFLELLEARTSSADPNLARRAKWVQDACLKKQ
jgi:hypothetical protein